MKYEIFYKAIYHSSVGLYCAAIAILAEHYIELALAIAVITIPMIAHLYHKIFPRKNNNKY